jgi:hypothetical protein
MFVINVKYSAKCSKHNIAGYFEMLLTNLLHANHDYLFSLNRDRKTILVFLIFLKLFSHSILLNVEVYKKFQRKIYLTSK